MLIALEHLFAVNANLPRIEQAQQTQVLHRQSHQRVNVTVADYPALRNFPLA